MKPYNIYLIDFSLKFFYNLISYVFCLSIIFFHINTIFLFETIPLLENLVIKRLILTKITQLFNSIWFTSIFWSFFFTFPLTFYYIKVFFISGWYNYQLKFFIKSFFIFLLTFFILYFLNQIILIPAIISFFLYWEVTDLNSLLRIEAEISIFYYVLWSLTFKFNFTFILTNILYFFWLIFKFISIKKLYNLIYQYKKIFVFLFLCFFFIVIPPDFIIQFLATIFFYIFFDFIFLWICIKLYVKLKTIKKK